MCWRLLQMVCYAGRSFFARADHTLATPNDILAINYPGGIGNVGSWGSFTGGYLGVTGMITLAVRCRVAA